MRGISRGSTREEMDLDVRVFDWIMKFIMLSVVMILAGVVLCKVLG